MGSRKVSRAIDSSIGLSSRELIGHPIDQSMASSNAPLMYPVSGIVSTSG